MWRYVLFFYSFTLYSAHIGVNRGKFIYFEKVGVKTLLSPFFAEIWRLLLSGRTQRHAWPRHKREEIIILNISFPRVEPVSLIPTPPVPFTATHLCSCATTGLNEKW